jgi:hypothetical protein
MGSEERMIFGYYPALKNVGYPTIPQKMLENFCFLVNGTTAIHITYCLESIFDYKTIYEGEASKNSNIKRGTCFPNALESLDPLGLRILSCPTSG